MEEIGFRDRKGDYMDAIDRKLIHLLAENADAKASSLVSRLNLSVPAINKRIARLKENGDIKKTTVLTDPRKMGKPVIAFVLIVLENFRMSDKLLRLAEADPDILECCAVTGEYDYILKICAADIPSFEDKLLTLKREGVAKNHTMLVLREHKFTPSPLPD